MNFEDLVPPVELCKLIPAGEFEDSALMWFSNYHFGGWHIEKRELAVAFTDNGELYPAPTLQEILASMPHCACRHDHLGWTVVNFYVDGSRPKFESNPTTAALKLWLKHKGIE